MGSATPGFSGPRTASRTLTHRCDDIHRRVHQYGPDDTFCAHAHVPGDDAEDQGDKALQDHEGGLDVSEVSKMTDAEGGGADQDRPCGGVRTNWRRRDSSRSVASRKPRKSSYSPTGTRTSPPMVASYGAADPVIRNAPTTVATARMLSR